MQRAVTPFTHLNSPNFLLYCINITQMWCTQLSNYTVSILPKCSVHNFPTLLYQYYTNVVYTTFLLYCINITQMWCTQLSYYTVSILPKCGVHNFPTILYQYYPNAVYTTFLLYCINNTQMRCTQQKSRAVVTMYCTVSPPASLMRV